jgi:two-component system chemotaxis sensor kinase CheA
MSLSSEERISELREIFFESAQEQLQALNEEGLHLEKDPGNTELIRNIRRAVHTLKGDAAACGLKELSQLAHELEDVLTPEAAAHHGVFVAQVVFSAADTLEGMLTAYRRKLQPPNCTSLRKLIHGLGHPSPSSQNAGLCTGQETALPEKPFVPQFAWSEPEYLAIQQAAGKSLFNVAIEIDPQCAMPQAAVELARQVLLEAGTVLAFRPELPLARPVQLVEAAIASERDPEWILRKCRIPGIAANVVVQPLAASSQPSPTPPETTEARSAIEGETPGPSAPKVPENLLRVDAARVETVLDLLGELIISRSMLSQAIAEFGRRFPKDPLRLRFTDILARQSQVLTELQRSAMKIRMVPVAQLFRRFPRLVRDLGKQLGKDVVLQISGEDTDLDKSILDTLVEPIVHLVRNAVDHGIESPGKRAQAGKPSQGCVRLNAFHQANQVVIEISDDGSGIDLQRIAAEALRRGIVSQDELGQLSAAEQLQLIFAPGFSTSTEVTQVSGRGVGLDVVKSVLERMKGTVSVSTRPAEGATFQLRVPLTLAIIKALLFRAGQRIYALPLAAVHEIARCEEGEIHRVEHHQALQLRGEVLTVIRLTRLAEPSDGRKGKKLFMLIVTVAGRKFGLVVDRLIGEEELVIKPLDDQLISTELVSGASILGDGTVALILNLNAVIERFGRSQRDPFPSLVGVPPDQIMGAHA